MSPKQIWAYLAGVVVGGAAALAAERADSGWGPTPSAAAGPPPARLAAELRLEPAVSMAAAQDGARDGLAAIAEWNRGGNAPPRTGFTRILPRPLRLNLDPASPAAAAGEAAGAAWRVEADGALIWTVRIRVEQAHRVRLRLTDLKLPGSARFWLFSDDGSEVGPFGLELRGAAGDLWTPSVGGETVTLELRVPRGAPHGRLSLAIAEIMEIVQLDGNGAPFFASVGGEADESCLVDGGCVTKETLEFIRDYRKAVARLEYIDAGFTQTCTGGLLNDSDPATFIPYLLTAQRCIGTQAAADTLEAAWSYHSATCGGPASLGTAPRSNGATLLASGAGTDFALLRLHSVPGDRFFLGWDATSEAASGGTVLHRLSHPLGRQQMYSSGAVDNTPSQVCFATPVESYLYSTVEEGGTFSGSTGAPAVRDDGKVVGQLRGRCGPNAFEPCLAAEHDHAVDGRFSQTFPSIAAFLEPGGGPCVEDATTACLLAGRYRATLRFRNGFDNLPVDTDAFRKPVTGFSGPAFETVFFYFNDVNNIEVVVGMLDQGNTNGAGQPTIAVKLGTATPLRVEATITDTTTGATRTYASEFGSQQGQTDFTAFVK
jgi:hypothetical protein